MKKLILIAALSISAMASAAEIPLFFKSERSSGFAPEQYQFVKICRVYENKIKLSITTIRGRQEFEKALTAEASWKPLIAEAQKGKIVDESGPADFGNIVFLAYQQKADGSVQDVVLHSIDENGWLMVNKSPAAEKLITIIDKVCEL